MPRKIKWKGPFRKDWNNFWRKSEITLRVNAITFNTYNFGNFGVFGSSYLDKTRPWALVKFSTFSFPKAWKNPKFRKVNIDWPINTIKRYLKHKYPFLPPLPFPHFSFFYEKSPLICLTLILHAQPVRNLPYSIGHLFPFYVTPLFPVFFHIFMLHSLSIVGVHKDFPLTITTTDPPPFKVNMWLDSLFTST